MKQIKMAFWLLVIVFIGLIVYQNQDLFLNKQSFAVDLFFIDEYKVPDLPNAIFFLAFFLIGLLIAYFFSLAERFKSKKAIKILNATVDSHLQEISALRSEVESLKGGASEKSQETQEANKSLDEARSA